MTKPLPFPYRLADLGDRPPLHDDFANATPRQLAYYIIDLVHHLLFDPGAKADPDQPDWTQCGVLVEASRSLLHHAIRRQKAEDRAFRRAFGTKRRV
ncbi:MAG: hypothetical protein WEB06_00550 [Actinomycetota bacterium]